MLCAQVGDRAVMKDGPACPPSCLKIGNVGQGCCLRVPSEGEVLAKPRREEIQHMVEPTCACSRARKVQLRKPAHLSILAHRDLGTTYT